MFTDMMTPEPQRQTRRNTDIVMDEPQRPASMNGEIVSVQEQRQAQLLTNGLITADRFINKNYLINVSSQNIVPLPEEDKTTGPIRLFRIGKLVYDEKENVNDKLISVYSALQNVESAAILIVDGDGQHVTFYIGTRSPENASTAAKILEKSFIGNFPGSTLERLKNSEIAGVMNGIVETEGFTSRNVSCVTVIPSMRDDDKDRFVQGIEKFVDTMQGERFTAVFIARPVSKSNLEMRKRGFEELYSALSPFTKTTLAYGDNYSKAVASGMSENFSHSVNNSISNTTGKNSSTSSSRTRGRNTGMGLNNGGFGMNTGSSDSTTSGYSSGESWSKAVTRGTADTTTRGGSRTDTETNGNSRTLTVEHQNKSVADMLQTIDQQLERIKACEAFGVWECAGYFVADDIQTSVVAANTYKALMLGDETEVENSFVNVWGPKTPQNTALALEYIQYGQHPLVEIAPEMGYEQQYVTPGNYISGKELPLLMGLPHRSVTGLTVSSIAEFGRNVFVQNARPNQRSIRLGRVYHMGNTEDSTVDLDLNSLTAHCFITGSTGSGKSNTTYLLLERLLENHIPFLVVEPAKGEYKDAFGAVEGLHVFSTNPLIGQMLKLNPFRFAPNIHVLEHLDRLIEIFNACWEMYAAMPAILKEAVEQIYIDKGWDLLNSIYMGEGEPTYPTFHDLMVALPNVINNSGYSAETKGDYTGALVTRVTSLTNGISGQIFCDNYDIPDKILFDENTIIDLSRVGSTETKSLIMGILVLKLSEYRMSTAGQHNSGLRHLTVLEEAHNLLKRATPGAAGSNVVGKSVEMICNSIAEMRTYGEGFAIVDQSPTAVDIAAIKNTNTKILMRLPEEQDCEAVGNAVGLNEEQIRELSRLGTGIAVVMQSNWLEAVLTHIDAASDAYERTLAMVPYSELRQIKGAVIQELMQQYIGDKRVDRTRMLQVIDQQPVSPYKQEELRCCVESVMDRLEKGRDNLFFCETLLNISGTRNLFDVMEADIRPAPQDSDRRYTVSSVQAWRQRFRHELDKYIDLPDRNKNLLIKYLIIARRRQKSRIDYGEIYAILYQGAARA